MRLTHASRTVMEVTQNDEESEKRLQSNPKRIDILKFLQESLPRASNKSLTISSTFSKLLYISYPILLPSVSLLDQWQTGE